MESVNISEDFRNYIRLNNKVEMPYETFSAILNIGEPVPNFVIALDGTYSHTKRHIDSKICLRGVRKSLANVRTSLAFLRLGVRIVLKLDK